MNYKLLNSFEGTNYFFYDVDTGDKLYFFRFIINKISNTTKLEKIKRNETRENRAIGWVSVNKVISVDKNNISAAFEKFYSLLLLK
jgi:hypothetical protein